MLQVRQGPVLIRLVNSLHYVDGLIAVSSEVDVNFRCYKYKYRLFLISIRQQMTAIFSLLMAIQQNIFKT